MVLSVADVPSLFMSRASAARSVALMVTVKLVLDVMSTFDVSVNV